MAEERYVLERQLGAGGMGDVWLATDTLLNRPVAVKFLQATDDPKHKEFFLSEARTLASLHHPNITTIYDAVFDDADKQFYIMMEYVEGKPLSDLIQEHDGPLPLETILQITSGVLSALDYAHTKGFVHRDIKPANIVIQPNGVIKLTDFGLAALVSILAEQDDGYVIGTPAYMAPEQILSEPLDGRSDLYALGITLFEMLSGGRTPFESADPHTLLVAQVEEEPVSVRTYNPTVSLMLERVVTRLLAKYPDVRYPSARALLDVLQAMAARLKYSQRHLQFLDAATRPLIGRATELNQINALWAHVQEAMTPRLLVVEGVIGIGKSRLITEFLGSSVIDKQGVVLVGRGDELGVLYTPYTEVLATIFDKSLVKPATIEGQMNYFFDQLPGLASLLNIERPRQVAPEKTPSLGSGLWQTLSSRVPNAATKDSGQTQWQLFSTFRSVLSELGPCVIYLDGAEHLDEASVALTRFLITQGKLPLLIVAEYRPSGDSLPWFDTFSPAEMGVINLAPLTSQDIKPFLVNFLEGEVSDALVRVVEKRGRGNPYHMEETTRQHVDQGDFYQSDSGEWRYQPPPTTGSLSIHLLSTSLTNAFTRRLEKLSVENKEALTLAALLEAGPEFEFETWLTLLGGEAQRLAAEQVVAEATELRLVRSAGDSRFAFRPSDVATALIASLSVHRKRELHQKIAQILVEQDAPAMIIAYHYEQAGLATDSAQFLEQAGARASAAHAVNQAIDCYKRALNLVETVSGYAALGDLYRQQGAWTEATSTLKRGLELAQETGTIERQAQILNRLAFVCWLSDSYRDGAQYASMVLKLPGASHVDRGTAQSHLGMISWLLGYLKEAEDWCQRAINSLQSGDDDAELAGAYNRMGLVYFTTAQYAEAQRLTSLSLELRRKLGDYWGEAYCLVGLSQIAADQGQFQQASETFSLARQRFAEIHSHDGLMVLNTEEGRARLLAGQVEEAVLLLGKALNQAKEIDGIGAHGLGDIHLLIAQASLALDELERANTAVLEALQLVESAGNRKLIALGKAIMAQVHATEHRPEQAEALFKGSLELFKEVNNPSGLLRTRLTYARFLATQGNSQVATALEQQTRTEAARLGLYLPA